MPAFPSLLRPRPADAATASHARPHPRRLGRLLVAADAAAVRWSARPYAALAFLLAANVTLAAAGVGLGFVLFDDPALYFRELMPGTLLNAATILAAALVARGIHRRDPLGRRWFESFWGLSAVLLFVLTVVELTQPTIFLGRWLNQEIGVRPPAGIADVDGSLMTVLLAAVAATLVTRVFDVLRHPRAVVLFACAALLGATSQFIDATARVSAWEFVVEDSFKAAAGTFLLAGYLVALGAVVRKHLRS